MPHHDNIPIWDVDISVIGQVSVNHPIQFNVRKELEHPEPFYSDIIIKGNQNGFIATVEAFAPNPDLAEKAALFFLGRMLDILALHINVPLQLDLSKNVFIPKTRASVRRRVDIDDFRNAFQEARLLSLTETTFLRALSWFRKGKYTQDPFDRFLAFWNSIETVANKYNPNKDVCRGKGTLCHIWECFKTIWGDCNDWEFIGGQTDWIDTCNNHRKNIAHGNIPIEIRHVEQVMAKMSELENVAEKFLLDWRNRMLKPVVSQEIRDKLS